MERSVLSGTSASEFLVIKASIDNFVPSLLLNLRSLRARITARAAVDWGCHHYKTATIELTTEICKENVTSGSSKKVKLDIVIFKLNIAFTKEAGLNGIKAWFWINIVVIDCIQLLPAVYSDSLLEHGLLFGSDDTHHLNNISPALSLINSLWRPEVKTIHTQIRGLVTDSCAQPVPSPTTY